MNETQKLAEYCANLEFGDLPGGVVTHTKNLILDGIGYTLGGSILEHSTIILDYFKRTYAGLANGASVFGFGVRLPLPEAVLLNGSMAHGPELDDCDNVSSVHPGACVMPAVLTVGEAMHSSGPATILAAVLGYEVMMRLGAAAGSFAQYERGFHPTATTSTFGTTAAFGSMLGIDAAQLANAFGIAGSLTAGSMEYLANGAWTKRLHPGAGGRNGLLAVELAKRGYTGPVTILEGKSGYLVGHTPRPALDELLKDIGKGFKISEISVKPFACCRDVHQGLTALFDLMAKQPIDFTRIERIDAEIAPPAFRIVGDPQERKRFPQTAVDAQFSLNYCIAVALVRKAAFLDEFRPEVMSDPRIQNLTARTFVSANPDLQKLYPKYHPTTIRITMQDGSVLTCSSNGAKGDPELPLTVEEYQTKFRLLATPVIGADQVEQVIELVSGFDDLADISKLSPLLSPMGRRA